MGDVPFLTIENGDHFETEQNLLDKLNKTNALDEIQRNKANGIFLLHMLCSKVTKVDNIKFLKTNWNSFKEFYKDNDERTLLHIAVKSERPIEVIKFLVKDLRIYVSETDTYGFTALHFACQKEVLHEDEIKLLMKDSKDLTKMSKRDETPLKFCCSNETKLKTILKIFQEQNISLDELLKVIDNLSNGLPKMEKNFIINRSLESSKAWLNMLRNDNEEKLLFFMGDGFLKDKYYLCAKDLQKIIRKCNENGQGILRYIKGKINWEKDNNCELLFTEFTGLRISEGFKSEAQVFHHSILFLALITGRLELVPRLLTFCQFNIILYGLLTCLICHKLSTVQEFSDQVIDNINKTKDFCEKYSIAVLNRTAIQDLTKDKHSIFDYLNHSENSINQNILRIAYLGKCSKFLSLPSCQKCLTKFWYRRNVNCPAVKFCTHSLVHCGFLVLFSYILIYNFFVNFSVEEIICYIYACGYFCEEIFQVYEYKLIGLLDFYKKNPNNYLDVGGLIFMGTGFILRIAVYIYSILIPGFQTELEESYNKCFFYARLFLCISLILFYLRIIYFGCIFEKLGPIVKMIGKMIVKDLLPLIFIFLIFIVSFGVVFQSLLFPNRLYVYKLGLKRIERKPWFFVLGEIFRRATFSIFDSHYTIDEIDSSNSLYEINEEGRIAVFFFLIIYIVVVNVMLTNLLIALFSNTVTIIIQKSKESWKAERYGNIEEYYERSICPPPLNIIEIIFFRLLRHYKKEYKKQSNTDGKESFKILQASGLKDYRYKLLETDDDKEREKEVELNDLKNTIARLNAYLLDIESWTR